MNPIVKSWYSKAVEQTRKEMVAEGQRIIRECVDERDYSHQTKNLYDSYGYGVYINGKLRNKGFLAQRASAKKPRKWYGEEVWGRDEITTFLEKEHTPSKFMELVVVAAMPYAIVLEKGGGGLHRKYKVVSMSYDKLKDVCPSFGNVKLIGL